MEICRKYDVTVIEGSAESLAANYIKKRYFLKEY